MATLVLHHTSDIIAQSCIWPWAYTILSILISSQMITDERERERGERGWGRECVCGCVFAPVSGQSSEISQTLACYIDWVNHFRKVTPYSTPLLSFSLFLFVINPHPNPNLLCHSFSSLSIFSLFLILTLVIPTYYATPFLLYFLFVTNPHPTNPNLLRHSFSSLSIYSVTNPHSNLLRHSLFLILICHSSSP